MFMAEIEKVNPNLIEVFTADQSGGIIMKKAY